MALALYNADARNRKDADGPVDCTGVAKSALDAAIVAETRGFDAPHNADGGR
jgi:hypothetical protein